MKKIFLIAGTWSLLILASCSSNNNTGTTSEDINATQESGQPETAAEQTPVAKGGDPVCGMEKDIAWTDFSLYNNDTVHFCSEGCKQAFDARPEKYITKK